MTRLQLIHNVKVLLDEVSPFEEDDTTQFMDIDPDMPDDIDYSKVKPIYTMINDQLDNSAKYCLNALPFSILSDDVEDEDMTVHIDVNGVGHIHDIESNMRFVSVRIPCVWERVCMDFLSSSDPRYLIQQNPHTRAGICKPVCVYVPERHVLECYSFPKKMTPIDQCDKSHTHATIYYIDVRKKAEKVKSHIEDFIALRCAAYVAEILENTNTANNLMAEYNAKLESILK